jgi:di/tricarboxylate transporter
MGASTIIIVAIIAAIGLGYYFKINIGLFGILFGYLIGAFVLQMKVKAIVALWPTKLFFMIMAITFFYGFAISNGTLEKIARKTVYATKKYPYLVPFALYALTVIMSGIGPGPYAVYVFLSPLIMAIAAETGMSRLLAAVIIVGGGVAGAFTKVSIGGGITKGLIENAGYVEMAELYTSRVFWNSLFAETIIFLIAYFALKGHKMKKVNIERPENFTREQKITLCLIIGALGAVVIPSTFAGIIPQSEMLSFLKKQIDVTFVSIMAAVLALFFKVGSEKEALDKVPWKTIILLCGMGVLIGVAVEAGTIDKLADWIGNNVSSTTAPLALTLIAGIMSFFSSTMGVVMPTLYPIVPGISEAAGVNPSMLFSIITIAAAFTGFSPFSSGGALTLTGVRDEAERNKLFAQLLILPIFAMAIAILLVAIGIIR